jgi:precorrin-6x reductase
MYRLIIFGGTTEGRMLCQWCIKQRIDFLYCTTTDVGVVPMDPNRVRVGRIDGNAMPTFLQEAAPELVIDATHPYADTLSATLAAACQAKGICCLRVVRQASDTSGCAMFSDEDSLIGWLAETRGVIFAATGVKEAALFTRLSDFKERVWFRLLPTIDGLTTCLAAGYPREHLILMWGPFSEELNQALFAAVGAAILVTKDSGKEGGFMQKKKAALKQGMHIAVIERPLQETGFSCTEAIGEIAKRLGPVG